MPDLFTSTDTRIDPPSRYLGISRQEYKDGYRIAHRPAKRPDQAKWIDGPVFIKGDVLYFLQFGMGSGPWIVMRRDADTGKQCRLRNSGEWQDRTDAEAGIRRLAGEKKWAEIFRPM